MPKVYVVGLGPGGRAGLPLGTYERLQSGLPVYLRTRIHPVVEDLANWGIAFTAFDDLYESGENFHEVYQAMSERLLKAAQEAGSIVYAVPGHPLMAEQSVQNLLHQGPLESPPVEVAVESGQSFFDPVCSLLQVDPIEGLCLLDGTILSPSQVRPDLHVLIAQVYSRQIASDVKLTLMELYPDDYTIQVVRAAGVPGEEKLATIPLFELDRVDFVDHLTTVYVPRVRAEDDAVANRDFWRLVELVRRLRDPEGGCPWDLKQTHKSLRPYVLEEAYEVASAIDEQDPHELTGELGDLLLQVLLHAQIASESGDFTVRDVFAALGDKLVRRHPHVFGDVRAASAAEAERFWKLAKEQETAKAQDTAKEQDTKRAGEGPAVNLLSKVQRGRPAWRIAREMQDLAAEAGFDWGNIHGVIGKVKEETAEIEQALVEGEANSIKNEVGDLLFTVVNVLRWLDLDLETVLAEANRKFEDRFHYVERRVQESGGDWKQLSLDQLEEFWQHAKTKKR